MDVLPASWVEIWALETPVAELLVRAAVLYFGILLLLRVMPRRTGGELGTMDLVMILLVTEPRRIRLAATGRSATACS